MSTFDYVGHGLSVGDPIYWGNLDPEDCGIVDGQTYYVLTTPTADTFTMSETDGGPEFDLTFDLISGDLTPDTAVYSLIADPDDVMAPPDPVPTPSAPTLTSALVSGIVRLRIELNDSPEAKLRVWEIQVTHKYDTNGDEDWATPLTISLPESSNEISIPALGGTQYSARVRGQDVYGNFSDYSTQTSFTTEVGADSLSAALADLANDVPDGSITGVKITDDAIIARHISAGSVTAAALEAIIILGSLIKTADTGARMEVDVDGIRLYDGSDVLTVRIPTDGSTAFFKGEIQASNFTNSGLSELADNVALTGDAIMTLANGVSAPTVAPTATPDNETRTLTTTPISPSGGIGYDSGGASVWIAADPASGYVAHEFDLATGVYVGSIEATGSTVTNTTTVGSTAHVADTAESTSDNAKSQIAVPIVIPAWADNAKITKISIYLAGLSGSAAVRNSLWTSGGSLERQTPSYTAASVAFSVGNAIKYDKAFTSPHPVTPGATYKVGAMLVSDSDAWWWDRDDGSSKTTYLGSGENQDDFTVTTTQTTHKPNVYITMTYDVDDRLEAAPMIGVCTDGIFVYTLDNTGVIWKYQQDLGVWFHVAHSAVQTAITGTKSKAGLFYDATAGELIVTTTTGTGAGVFPKFVRIDPSTLAVSSSVYSAAAGTTFSGTTDTFRGGARLDDPLNGDAATYWVATTSAVYAYTFSGTTATQTSNRDFGSAIASGDGLMYDGTQFWGYDTASPTVLTKFTNWDWTTASDIYWTAYAWYDPDGTTHETAVSPRTSTTMKRRQRLLVNNPAVPGGGGADDPDQVRIYTKPNATDPGAGALKLQVTDALSGRYLTDYDSGGAADGAGTAFPSGTAAQIKSAGTGWTLKGSGLINRVGTSFPPSPSTNDMYYRSDLNMEFFYDGTHWMSTQLFETSAAQWGPNDSFLVTLTGSRTAAQRAIISPLLGSDIWLVSAHAVAFVGAGTALSGSHKWVATFNKNTASDAATSLGTASIDSGASSNWHRADLTIGALLGTTYLILSVDWAKTGTPGNLTISPPFVVRYRVVAT